MIDIIESILNFLLFLANDLGMMEIPKDVDIENNPYVMSKTKPMGQHSFVDSRQKYNKLAPPPKYFTDQILT